MKRLILVVLIVSGCAGGSNETPETPETPEICLQALLAAENVIELAADGLDKTAQAFSALSEGDFGAVNDVAEWMGAAAPEMTEKRAIYDAAAAACRSEGP